MRAVAVCWVAAASGVAFGQTGQTADLRIRLDATLSYRTEASGPTNLRLYGTDGTPSIAALSVNLPTGFRGFVSEKLERITGDPDRSLLYEYYFEDPGLWRLGKQLIPFGLTRVIHETVLAARADTNLIIQGLPVSATVFDAGKNLQQGVSARIGSRIGVSAFYGHDFGIASESFTQVREPEESPGAGHGYQLALALDGSRRFGRFELKGEFVSCTQGETNRDPPLSIADGTITYQTAKRTFLTAGYTWDSDQSQQFMRFGGILPVTRGVDFEPMIRFKNNALWDISLEIRVRV